MKFDTLLKTQRKIIKLFHNSLRKKRLVHIYLFEGAKGTPKLEAAYYFAAMMLCRETEKPCLRCWDCLRVQKEIHPSVFLVRPETGTIRKQQIETLEREFSLTALSEDARIFIIEDMKKQRSQPRTLLKFTEELDGDKFGIMLTENVNQVLPTIRSRAQIVSFEKLPEVVAEELISRVEEETSRVLSKLPTASRNAWN